MKHLYTILFVLCFVSNSIAQPVIPQNYRMIALHITDEQTKKEIPNLRISLCKYNGQIFQVVYQKNNSSNRSSTTFKNRKDSTFLNEYSLSDFQKEQINKIAKNDYMLILPNIFNAKNTYYTMHDKVGDVIHSKENWNNYVLRETNNKINQNEHYIPQIHPETPLLKIVIDDMDGDKNGTYASREFMLPQSMIYDLDENINSEKTIDIVLSEKVNIPISYNLFTTYIIQHIMKNTISDKPWSAFNENKLEQVDIVDEHDGILLQRLKSNDEVFKNKNWQAASIEIYDYDGRNKKQKLPNFRIRTGDNEYAYYIYNSETYRYTYDSVLSKEVKDFQLEVETPKKIVYDIPLLECLQTNNKLPILYFQSGQKQLIFKDTFWVWNPTNADIKTYLNPYYHQHWTLDSIIKAKGKAPLIYTRIYDTIAGAYEMINECASIKYNGNNSLGICVYGQVINPKAVVKKYKDGSLSFLFPTNEYLHHVVNTFPNGILKEAGNKRNSDSAKVGGWTKKAKFGDGYDVQYFTSDIKVFIKNADIKKCRFYYRQMWVANDFEFFPTENPFIINLPMAANEIIVKSDSANINYRFQQGDGKPIELYLLKPNESYIFLQGVKRPVDFNHHQYAIIWHQIANNNIQEKIQQLKNEFPNLIIENNYYKTIVDAKNLSANNKEELLQQLELDKDVLCITKLIGKDNPFLFNNRIYCITKEALAQTQIEKTALKYGFTFVATTAVDKFTHFFKYKNKLMNEEAIKDFNALAEELKYYNFDLEHYINALPEKTKSNNEK